MTKDPAPTSEQVGTSSDLDALQRAAATCTACDLYARATQTVFGEGRAGAPMMLIGEQPGNQEDLEGRPFVGPAGQLLDRALAAAGIERGGTYVTNAVKHFKWRPAGKVRLHQTPNAREVRACANWWKAELATVGPMVVVLLGATAAKAVLGPAARVTHDRGKPLPIPGFAPGGPVAVVTMHPSAVVRMKEPDRTTAFDALVADLRVAVDHLAGRRQP
jgi:uracil-DNA glycosylase family protein